MKFPPLEWLGRIGFGAALATTGIARAEIVWQHDWLVFAPTTFGAARIEPDAPLAFDSAGGMLIEGQSPISRTLFARLDSAGSLLWSADLQLEATLAMIATADGGAYVLPYGSSGAQLVRFDAAGAKVWSRSVPGLRIVEAGSGYVAVSDIDWLTLLSTTTGDVVWQRRINHDAVYSDDAVSLAADATGNLYVTTGVRDGVTNGARTVKFDPAGDEQWNVVASTSTAQVLAVSGSTLYERVDGKLQGVRVDDGSIAWAVPLESPDSVVAVSGDAQGEPIVAESSAVRRLAASDGHVRWERSLAGYPKRMGAAGNRIVSTAPGQFVGLDATSGAIAWSTTRPTVDAHGNGLEWRAIGGFHGDEFVAVAMPIGSYANAPAFLQRVHSSTGALASAITPMVPQGTRTVSVAQQSGSVISASVAPHANAVDLQLRKLDGTSGIVAWQVSDPVDDFGADGPFYPTSLAVAERAGKVATAMPLQDASCRSTPSGARVSLHDGASGARSWRTLLMDADRVCTRLDEPQLDVGGNVLVSTSEGRPCGNGQSCYEAAIYKLAASDGHVAWRQGFAGESYPRPFVVAGDRVVSVADGGFQALAVDSGASAWSSNLYPGNAVNRYVFKLDETHVVLVGATSQGTSWAKLDAATGVVLWDRSVAHEACASSCFENAPTVLSGGDLLIHGRLGSRALLRRFHNDGSGTVDEWLVGADAPSQQAWINRAEADADGRLDLQLARRPGGTTPPSIHTFARFDMASGVLSDEQFLAAYSEDPYEQLTYPDLLRQVDADRFLVQTYATRPPQTATTGVALLDLATAAHGDLAIEARLDRASAAIGDTVGFHLRATYTGDAATQGATLFAHMPWPSGVTAPACATSGAGNCVVDVDSGDVRATFDVAPGGSIEITGTVRVLGDPARPLLSAFVHGTGALGESDMRNNFAAAETSLFVDGFDAH